MRTNHKLRESLLLQVESAYISFAEQIDHLLGTVQFYLERYPEVTIGDSLMVKELIVTVSLLEKLNHQLAGIVSSIKSGYRGQLTPMYVEVFVLNEMWANIHALKHFIEAKDISLDPFDFKRCAEDFAALMVTNRLLT